MKDKIVGEHCFVFNPEDNGGESLSLTTKIFDNGDDKRNIYLNQELSLQSYGNSVTLNLYGANLTPKNLRELANELEKKINKYEK